MKLEGEVYAEARRLQAKVAQRQVELADADLLVAQIEAQLVVAQQTRTRARGRALEALVDLRHHVESSVEMPKGSRMTFDPSTGEVLVEAPTP